MTTENMEKLPETACLEPARKSRLMDEEFNHTRKRLARSKVAPLVQFCVFAYDCKGAAHEVAATHIDYASMGSSVQVSGGLQASIAAVEALLAALKAKLQ